MRTIYDLVDVDELTLVGRGVLEREVTNRLAAYLPFRSVTDIDWKTFKVGRANRAASIRAFDTPAQRGRRPAASTKRGSLPAVSELLDLTESETLRLRRLAGGELGNAIADNVFNDAVLCAQAVANRYELLRGEVLATGQIVIDEGGVDQAIDYEVPDDLIVTAAAGWDTEDAEPFTDLLSWFEAYNDHGNDGVGVLLTSTRVRGLMLRDPSIRALVRGVGPGVPTSPLTPAELDAELSRQGLPPIATYDRKVEDAEGDLHRVIPQGQVMFLPGTGDAAGRLGETQMGVTEEAVNAVEAREISVDDAPGLIVLPLRQDHPPVTSVLATSIGLPVLSEPERLLTASVLDDEG